MSAKTLWYISQYSAPIKYGFGTRHFYLSEELVKKGWNVHVVSSSFNKFFEAAGKFPPGEKVYNFEEENGVKICWIKGFKYKKNEGIGRIFSWLVFTFRLFFLPMKHFNKPDVIILSSLSLPPIIAAWFYKKKFGCKLIFEIRDIWPQTLIDVGNYSPNNPFVKSLGWVERFGYSVSDHITATMPGADLHIKNVFKKPFKFTCIPQGFDSDFFSRPAELSADYVQQNIPKGKFVIGYAGTLGKSNALETIIDAVKELETEFPLLHLVLLGHGPLKEQLTERAKGAQNISFAPKVDKSQVQSFLKHCDVLYDSVMSVPLYRYGLSRNKWMDYMYSAKPMLVSYTGYLSLINEADCGIVVPSEDKEALKDAVRKMLVIPSEELKEMGKRGKEFLVKHRTYAQLADNYLKIFNT
jgi:glycosyltransferase involved in cell wall biosynthesis